MEYFETLHKGIIYIPQVCEYPDLHPIGKLGLPPVKLLEFRINLIPGVTPVIKSHYQLTSPKMETMSNQL